MVRDNGQTLLKYKPPVKNALNPLKNVQRRMTTSMPLSQFCSVGSDLYPTNPYRPSILQW